MWRNKVYAVVDNQRMSVSGKLSHLWQQSVKLFFILSLV
jgi:hypothetical protein